MGPPMSKQESTAFYNDFANKAKIRGQKSSSTATSATQAISLHKVVIGGLTVWMGGSGCGVGCIMSTLWLSRQHGPKRDDHAAVRST